jgi:hypothetical protein
MIQDPNIAKAIAHIIQRSERQTDVQKLLSSYVDAGILPQLQTPNTQILFGRRGTGKTHVFHVLKTRFEEAGYKVIYIDARTLGSSEQFNDTDLPIQQRCISLFRDILEPVCNAIIEYIIDNPNKNQSQALSATDNLLKASIEPTRQYQEKSMTQRLEQQLKKEQSESAQVSLKDLSAGLNYDKGKLEQQSLSEQKEYDVKIVDKVMFPSIHKHLTEALSYGNFKLAVLLDEWSALPIDIQPYLSEFIKRGLLPVKNVLVKIASLEHRSQFSLPDNNIGFELGADVSAAQDLDDYYVYDRNPEQIVHFYADIVFRHLSLELEDNYLISKYKITNSQILIRRLFTDRKVFCELSRACEGVIRDLINIFNISYFIAQRKKIDKIDKKSVVEAARLWFEQDKAQLLDDRMRLLLRKIVDEVIGKKKARAFLLPREYEKHILIQKLFDARILHHMQRGYSDRDNPGTRYNIYNLDYGTYVDLIGTSREPDVEMKNGEAISKDIVVPFDDKRSIRRIILTDSILNI